MKVMETKTLFFTNRFGAHSHSINKQISYYIILPKTLKVSTKLVSYYMMPCYVNLPQLSLSPTIKVIQCLQFSNSEDGIETETTEIRRWVRVKFQLEKECEFGDGFLIVGDDPILGSWSPSDAIPFNWSEGHIWSVMLELPVEKSIQYKFLLRNKTGEILWQPGPDRSFEAWETKNCIIVTEKWDHPEAQKINEKQQTLVEHAPKAPEEEHTPAVDSQVGDLGYDENAVVGDDGAHLRANSSSSAVKKGRSPDRNDQRKVAALRKSTKQRLKADKNSSAKVEDEGNLVSCDEGPVLVPGLTLLVSSSEEALAEENQELVLSENLLDVDAPKNQNI